MCDDGCAVDHEAPSPDPALDPVLSGHFHPSRRSVLRASGAAVLAAATSSVWLPSSAWGTSQLSLTGSNPVRNAMHVHASWSEGSASWESQFAQAAAIGTDVLWMTDHDMRALAYKYLTSLNGIVMVNSQTGSLARGSATNTAGIVRVLAESASKSVAGSMSCAIQSKPAAFNRLRTGIAGQQLTVRFPACRIDSGGWYDVVVQLSNHPAFGARPAGQFELHYRFGGFGSASYVDDSGIRGVVTNPKPAPGSQYTFDLTADVAALWPDMLALDNAFYLLTLVASSPAAGKVVDVSVTVGIARSQNNSDSLIANQQTIVDTYGPRYPALNVYPTVEISRLNPHIIPFGVPQFWPDQTTIPNGNHDAAYDAITASVHSQGGLVSWNHPFGATAGPLLSATDQVTKRRTTFASMTADRWLGTDLLEVGYSVRGFVNTQTHLDLWDTFSRHAIFFTGNGVNDDHQGLHWATLSNGFATGIWATSPSQADLVSALAAGRAYTYHAGRWPNGQLDLAVHGDVPMGSVLVSSAIRRTLTIFAASLPPGSLVDVVRGPVDYTGNDPGTRVIATVEAATFGSAGKAAVRLSTATSCFVRVQVRTSKNVIVGISNPIWLLQKPPPGGVPVARLA